MDLQGKIEAARVLASQAVDTAEAAAAAVRKLGKLLEVIRSGMMDLTITGVRLNAGFEALLDELPNLHPEGHAIAARVRARVAQANGEFFARVASRAAEAPPVEAPPSRVIVPKGPTS